MAETPPSPQPPSPLPPQPMQIMLPPPLQEVMLKFPDMEKRVIALESKPMSVSGPPALLVAACAYLAGIFTMIVLVFLWHYGAVIFRL